MLLKIFSYPKKPPLAAVAAIFFILLLEAFNIVFDNYMDEYPYDGLVMKFKNQISQTKNTNFDILILGDCYNLEGLNARIIEQSTGLKTFNYAVFSHQTVISTYFFLKNHLQHNSKKPRFIVLNFITESTFLKEATFYKENIPYMFHIRDGNLFSFVNEIGFNRAVLMQIPSLKNRDFFLKGRYKKGLASNQAIKEFKNNFMSNKGQYTRHQDKNYLTCLPALNTTYAYEPSPFFLKYLYKILDLAKSNNIVVLFPMFTSPEDMRDNLYKPSHIYEIYFDLLNKLKNKYPHLIFWGWQNEFTDRGLYRDCIHLNQKGSEKISLKLAEIIAIANTKMLPN